MNREISINAFFKKEGGITALISLLLGWVVLLNFQVALLNFV